MTSIIIPNFNGAPYLGKCIESIRKCDESVPIIVVDNDSTDNSVEITKQYKGIKVVELKENLGFSRAVNIGIKKAESDYIILLNNDIEVGDDWLKKLLNFIKDKPNAFACASYMIDYCNRDLVDDGGDYYTILGWAFKHGLGQKKSLFNPEEEIFSACAGAAIYPKVLLEKVGYFDEEFFAYLEDIDLSFRAVLAGYQNYFCQDAVVYHIGSATTGGKYNKFKVYLTARNTIYVIYKNLPIQLIIINIGFILLGIFIKLLFFTGRGYGKEFLAGTVKGLITLKNFKEKRKIIMQTRKLSSWSVEKILIKNTVLYFSYFLIRKFNNHKIQAK